MLSAFANELGKRNNRDDRRDEDPHRARMSDVFQYERHWNEQQQELEDHLADCE